MLSEISKTKRKQHKTAAAVWAGDLQPRGVNTAEECCEKSDGARERELRAHSKDKSQKELCSWMYQPPTKDWIPASNTNSNLFCQLALTTICLLYHEVTFKLPFYWYCNNSDPPVKLCDLKRLCWLQWYLRYFTLKKHFQLQKRKKKKKKKKKKSNTKSL